MVERMKQLGNLFYKCLNPTNEYVLVTCPLTEAPPPMTFTLGISITIYQGSIRRQIHWIELSLGCLGPGTLLDCWQEERVFLVFCRLPLVP